MQVTDTMKLPRSELLTIAVTLVIVLMGPVLAAPLEHLEISTTTDTSYLPYRCVEYESEASPTTSVTIERRIHLWDTEPDSTGEQRYLLVRNGNRARGMPAIISLRSFPSRKLIDDTSLRLSVKDCQLYYLGKPLHDLHCLHRPNY